ncbi:polymeric immunoglobulin receptor-like [Astatotilapia calliptera]|uniref:polymeric immunoglobulin receptor-like n=1 Tax=Astatotilapia calliptera TaxID=8154 RepID=UPI000E41C48A|nr:polymeric immunoglobulin receptor-like [Astatotilapia calliptera]
MLKKFTVNITSLSQEDSGYYLCGVRRNFAHNVFSAVLLEVEEFCCVKSTKINGTVGHPLTLQCPYPSQHRDNRKFLCKGDQHNSCTDMLKNQSRFTLQDASSSTFIVIISKLEAADAGTYWCGSDSQWRVGNYTKIQLSVFPQSTLGKKNTALYVIPPVLLLICILVLVYKYRRSRIEEAVLSLRRNASRKKSSKKVIGAAQSELKDGFFHLHGELLWMHVVCSQQNIPNASMTHQINSKPFICLINNDIIQEVPTRAHETAFELSSYFWSLYKAVGTC